MRIGLEKLTDSCGSEALVVPHSDETVLFFGFTITVIIRLRFTLCPNAIMIAIDDIKTITNRCGKVHSIIRTISIKKEEMLKLLKINI